MAYSIRITGAALKQLEKLDKPAQRRILAFLRDKAAVSPRDYGAALEGGLAGYWKYRIGDYRAIVEIQDSRLIVEAVKVGHRKDVYR